jgi:hypothetical protein
MMLVAVSLTLGYRAERNAGHHAPFGEQNAMPVTADTHNTSRFDRPSWLALTAELLRVVDETMQPEFIGSWLRKTEPEVQR